MLTAQQPNYTSNRLNPAEIANENLACLLARWTICKESVRAGVDKFNMSVSQAEKLSALTIAQINMLSEVNFSLMHLDSSRFGDLMKMVDTVKVFGINSNSTKVMADNVVIKENRAGLVKRWHASQVSEPETVQRFGMEYAFVQKLSLITYDQLDVVAELGVPLFKLACDDKLLELACLVESSKELSRMSALRGN